jgi:predicted ATPase
VGATTFVGRERELGILEDNWRLALAGVPRVVAISGEPGIGKSRLLDVFKNRIGPEARDVFFLACSPLHQASALHPVIELLEKEIGFSPGQSSAERSARIEQWLDSAGLLSSHSAHLMASLLSVDGAQTVPGISPQRQRQHTLDLIVEWLFRWAHAMGSVLVIEDLHWADPSTLDLVQLLHTREARARLLTCITFRPQPVRSWPPSDRRTELLLQPLAREETEQLVASVARDKVIPPAVLRQLVARSGGVPLFAEEVTKAILESGILAERGDHFEQVGPLSDRIVPTTTRDSVMSRIDRLGPSRATAQLAAVLGREFRFDVLRTVSRLDEATLEDHLSRLVAAGLAHQTGAPPQASYMFNHAIIQDAAYESLLRRTRQDFHQRIAEALTQSFPEIASSQPELIARHYEGAGLLRQAAQQWEIAGHRALERAANLEAIAHLTRAIGALGDDPEGEDRGRWELTLQLRLAPALMAIHGWASTHVEVACARARELAEQLHDANALLGALWGLWTVHFVRGELGTALTVAQRVLSMGMEAGAPMLQILGRHAVSYTHYFRGEFAEARDHARQGIALFDLEQERTLTTLFQLSSSVALRGILALALLALGRPREAAEEDAAAAALAAKLAHRPSTAFALTFSVYYAFHIRSFTRVRELSEQLHRISSEEGFELWIAVAVLYRAWAQAMDGGAPEGVLAEMEKGLTRFNMTGTGATFVQVQMLVAEVRWRSGAGDAALAAVDVGLAHAAERGERYYEPELHRLRGEILAHRGRPEDVAEAEAAMRRAVQNARQLQAKSFELRALTGLARLLLREGRGREIRESLAAAREWFAEGLDAREANEMSEASALLAEIAGAPHTLENAAPGA